MSAPGDDSPSLTLRGLALRAIASVGLGGLFLWLAVRSLLKEGGDLVDGQGFGQAVLSSASEVGWLPVALYALIFVALHILRSLRWVVQVSPLAPELPKRWIFRVCAIGYAAIILLPLRLGEVARPLLLSRNSRLTFAQAMGTAVLERIVDGLLISLLLFAALALAPMDAAPVIKSAGWVSLLIFLGAGGGALFFVVQPRLASALIDSTFGRISEKISSKLKELLGEFVAGLGSLRRGGTWQAFVLLTALYWLTNAAGIMVLARAFGFELSLLAAFGALAVLVVGIMVPAGPGFLGNFQFFLAAGLSLYVSTRDSPAATLSFALVLNLVQFAVQVAFAVPFGLAHLRSPEPGELAVAQRPEL